MIFEEGFSFSGFERDKFWLNSPDGAWFDVSNISGADDDNDGRSLCLADFDDDGDVDFFVHNIQRERHRLYRNDCGDRSGNGWIKVRLKGTTSHPSAAGAVVRAKFGDRRQAKLMSLGSGFLSQNAGEMVFGLGEEPVAELEVVWPGGTVESFGSFPAGSRLRLVEGSGAAELVEARTFEFADPSKPGLRLQLGDQVDYLPLIEDSHEVELEVGSYEKLIVNFWATYCVACVAELPALQELDDRGRVARGAGRHGSARGPRASREPVAGEGHHPRPVLLLGPPGRRGARPRAHAAADHAVLP